MNAAKITRLLGKNTFRRIRVPENTICSERTVAAPPVFEKSGKNGLCTKKRSRSSALRRSGYASVRSGGMPFLRMSPKRHRADAFS